MFIRNLQKEDIGPITFAGFEFTFPANSVSAVWNDAGKYFTTALYKVEARVPGEGGIPPMIPVTEKDWDGATYAQVRRFKLDHSRIPDKNDLLRIAEERGVHKELLNKFRTQTIENEEIVAEINHLPIPEEIRFPERKSTMIPNVSVDGSLNPPVTDQGIKRRGRPRKTL